MSATALMPSNIFDTLEDNRQIEWQGNLSRQIHLCGMKKGLEEDLLMRIITTNSLFDKTTVISLIFDFANSAWLSETKLIGNLLINYPSANPINLGYGYIVVVPFEFISISLKDTKTEDTNKEEIDNNQSKNSFDDIKALKLIEDLTYRRYLSEDVINQNVLINPIILIPKSENRDEAILKFINHLESNDDITITSFVNDFIFCEAP